MTDDDEGFKGKIMEVFFGGIFEQTLSFSKWYIAVLHEQNMGFWIHDPCRQEVHSSHVPGLTAVTSIFRSSFPGVPHGFPGEVITRDVLQETCSASYVIIRHHTSSYVIICSKDLKFSHLFGVSSKTS